jgi:NADPH-dependent glutamate synthase beta subunit-like oxidoreductase
MTRMRPRVAIVGAGPAGAFAAASLLRARGDAEIDLFERLPTPWGLLRAGVAPDHQEIKRLERTFDRHTLARGCRFFGNVEVGADISHDDLMRHYSAVIYATGAQTDKSLGIPGEDLPGSRAATEFVGWYNGHPDYRDLEFDLSAERVVVIGNGNVAASGPTSPSTRSRRFVTAASARWSSSAAAGPRRPRSRAPSCASWATSTASTCASSPRRSSSTRCRASG